MTLDFPKQSNIIQHMRTFLLLTVIFGAILGSVIIGENTISSYHYEKSYSQLWQLADKSSTIPAKQEYISQFLTALKDGKARGDFADYNAIFLKTPNNSFDSNLKALETLSHRLTEIQNMNPSSFEYNTAIQQITAQEQGEAGAMLAEFNGCYLLNNYLLVWGWIGFVAVVISLICFIGVGFFTIMFISENGWTDNRRRF